MIETFKTTGLKIEDQGHPLDYIGTNTKKNPTSTYEFLQLALIDPNLDDVDLTISSKVKPIPMSSSKILPAHLHSKPFHEWKQFKFNYCSVIGKLKYVD